MTRKKRQNLILGVIAVISIVLVISFFYSAEQTRKKGFIFGNNLQSIQEDLKKIQTDFQTEITIWKEKEISKDELLAYSKKHISKMEELVSRYDTLEPPESFTSSVELFKLSAQSQLESDKEFIKWIKTGDESAKIRSDSLLQEAFDYEMAGLTEYNSAKAGINP